MVYINGKPSPVRGDFLASYLQQIPSGMVEKVEVIPNPSAKFDPDGMAGIINLVMKQDSDLGTSGGLTLGIGTSDSYNASGNLNFQKGKLSLFTNYGFRYDDRLNTGYNFRENRYLDPLTYLEQNEDGSRKNLSNMVNVNADYAFNKKDVLSASAQMSLRNGDGDGVNTYAQLGTNSELTGLYDRLSGSANDGFNMDYKLSFKRTIETSKHEFSADLRYNRSNGSNDDLFTQQLRNLDGTSANATPDLQRNNQDNLENEYTAQVDYVRPLGAGRLETGYKGTLQQLDNGFYSEQFDYGMGAYLPDLNLNNEFIYNEQVHAAYGILSGSVGKLDLQGGVRLEQALTTFDLTTTSESFDNNYFSVFPSAFASYKFSDTRAIRLSYSKRIQRPRTRMLNPFTNYNDPLNLFVGNPYLKPEYVHAYELSLQQFSNKGSLSLAPYYRKTINQMERFKTIDPATGISTTTFENFDSSESWGSEIIGSLRLGQKLNGFASFNLYKVVTNGSNVDTDLSNSAISWSSRFNATWQVRPGLDLQASYFYRAPTDMAQGRISAFSRADISIRQKFMNDKASLTLRVSDPFDQMGFKFIVDDNTFYQLGERKWQSRNAYLAFTYNFGRQPQRRNRDRNDNAGGGDMGGDVGIN
ncbi:MAG: TonB-dependent receptor [Rhodothermales bacterium]